ncbi:Alpha/Beta hydrolase protein [Elsinoe ampelina]|uniref:Alpha/Beta hydrolase protein n=1 Tax=Elsinoe ampelina TaxID=302913 RepID=A0A6A6G288_9PEZI|nr:Alpha/Beta hydrolase protein [Elsinoe ampelina]
MSATAIEHVVADDGVSYAYRRIGDTRDVVPLVMHIHFRANMFYWDPTLIQSLAKHRQVIVFDNAGIGSSTGDVPSTYQGWAGGVIAFVKALQLPHIDLLGFSMGGYTVQMVALTAPHLIRRLILAGTGPSEPASNPGNIIWPREPAPPKPIKVLSSAVDVGEMEKAIAFSFFYDDDEGRAAAKRYWTRITDQEHPRGQDIPLDPLNLDASKRQRQAAMAWHSPNNSSNSHPRLHELQMPTLILNGDHDVLISTSRNWELHVGIKNSQLIIYPRSGHGFLWQYPELVANHISTFLDRDDFVTPQSEL